MVRVNASDAVGAVRAVGAPDAVDAVRPVVRSDPRGGHDRRRREQDRWHRSWERALDELELDVDRAEELLHDEHAAKDLPPAPWTPPADLGPLPLELRPRADAILERQIAVAKQIATSLTMNRRQAAAIARIETGNPDDTPRPAYLDYRM